MKTVGALAKNSVGEFNKWNESQKRAVKEYEIRLYEAECKSIEKNIKPNDRKNQCKSLKKDIENSDFKKIKTKLENGFYSFLPIV